MINFNKMIDNHLKRENRPKQIGRYYPSAIGTCLRKQWFSYKFPMDVKPDLIKIFELGNILHDFVVEVLKSEKNPHIELLKSEFPIKIETEEFVISGRVDNLILIKRDGKNYLVEVKSIKDINYVKEPSENYVMQLQFYMHTTGVHNGIILYVSKTDLQSKAFEINYDEEKANEILKRFRELHRNLVNNNLPSPEAKEVEWMNWMCKYCEYRERCEKLF